MSEDEALLAGGLLRWVTGVPPSDNAGASTGSSSSSNRNSVTGGLRFPPDPKAMVLDRISSLAGAEAAQKVSNQSVSQLIVCVMHPRSVSHCVER